MPASLLTEMGSGLENQRALQIALELSKLGLNDNEAAAAASISMPTSSSAYEHNEAVVKKSANMTECVPVPSSEHVAEIVGRQGECYRQINDIGDWIGWCWERMTVNMSDDWCSDQWWVTVSAYVSDCECEHEDTRLSPWSCCEAQCQWQCTWV